MADNVTVTAGSATYTAGTDERTINGTAVHVQRVNEQGSTAVATGQVVVTTSAGTLLAARDTRKRVVFRNDSNQDIFIGPATVTTANGFKLEVGYSITLYTTVLLQAIIASGTMSGVIYYLEEYDA